MRDIAARAGVSASAVSLALRNSPEVSEALRLRIKKLAGEMGYRPNPLLSAYQSQVRTLKPVSFKASIAWINDHVDESHWKQIHLNPLWKGARERAHILGYELEEIWLPVEKRTTGGNEAAPYEKILRARGIHAAILPMVTRLSLICQSWREFSVVCLGRDHNLQLLNQPRGASDVEHHVVTHDDYDNVRLAVDHLRQSGCKRIGLAISEYVHLESDGLLVAGYLDRTRHLPRSKQLPMLMDTDKTPNKDVDAWIKKYNPDAVIISNPSFRDAVERAGLRIPEDIRLAHLHLAEDVKDWTGIDRDWHRVGGAAVDVVTAHLTRNERGIPAFPKKMLIRGLWVEGET